LSVVGQSPEEGREKVLSLLGESLPAEVFQHAGRDLGEG